VLPLANAPRYVVDPHDPTCADPEWKHPPELAEADARALCAMPTHARAPVCGVLARCDAGELGWTLCWFFPMLVTLCGLDGGGTTLADGCAAHIRMCQTPGSLVDQCMAAQLLDWQSSL